MGPLCIGEGWKAGCHPSDNSSNPQFKFSMRSSIPDLFKGPQAKKRAGVASEQCCAPTLPTLVATSWHVVEHLCEKQWLFRSLSWDSDALSHLLLGPRDNSRSISRQHRPAALAQMLLQIWKHGVFARGLLRAAVPFQQLLLSFHTPPLHLLSCTSQESLGLSGKV